MWNNCSLSILNEWKLSFEDIVEGMGLWRSPWKQVVSVNRETIQL